MSDHAIDHARMILGLIKLKEAIYARRSEWTEADRSEFLYALRAALESTGALQKEPPPSRPLRLSGISNFSRNA